MASAGTGFEKRLTRAEVIAAQASSDTPIWTPLPGPQTMAYESLADVIGMGGAAGGGKGLALDTPLRTPTGWTTMGEIEEGDFVLDEKAEPCTVLAVSAVHRRQCFRLTFDDGSTLVADDAHRWVTFDAEEMSALTPTSNGTMRDTLELAGSLRTPDGQPNHAVRFNGKFRYLLACDPVETVPTRCIAVDAPSRQYLAGTSLIPTHNSDLIVGLALTKHKRVAIFRRYGTELLSLVDRFAEVLGTRDGLNQVQGVWRLGDRQIEFGSVPNLGDEKRYQGRPKSLLAADESTSFHESQVRYLMGWVRSVDPQQHCQTLLTFNPPTNAEGRWVIRFFAPWLDPKHHNPAQPGELRWYAMLDGVEREVEDGTPFEHNGELIKPQSRTFIPARVTDNPHLANTGYVAQLQSLPEPLRSQMLHGNFQAGAEDDSFQVIPTAWVEAAMSRWKKLDKKPRMDSVGVDVARGGRDQTVISRRHGQWYDEMLCYPGSATPDGPTVAGLVIAAARDRAPIHVDVIGVGASPLDFLVDARQQAYGVNVAESPNATDKSGRLAFANLRSQLWWQMREALEPTANNGLALPDDRRLLADLCAPKWELRGSVVQVESRDAIVKRIGRSPDFASALMLAMIDSPRDEDLLAAMNANSSSLSYNPYDQVRVESMGYDPWASM